MAQVLVAIEGADENLSAFGDLKKALHAGAQCITGKKVGWQGGSVERSVYWLPSEGIWSILDRAPPEGEKGTKHRFWNCFGLGDPNSKGMLKIIVEINPPHASADLRVGGTFARDQEDRVYIAHSGKVGGGRKGIGQAALIQARETDDWQEISTSRGLRKGLVFGPLDSLSFPNQIADFVRKVAAFKEGAR